MEPSYKWIKACPIWTCLEVSVILTDTFIAGAIDDEQNLQLHNTAILNYTMMSSKVQCWIHLCNVGYSLLFWN
jgi:hypothetical protein